MLRASQWPRSTRWVTDGTAAPKAPRLQTTGDEARAVRARRRTATCKGGIRTPQVDAPGRDALGSRAERAPSFCGIFGTTKPFDAAKLAALYPSHAAFVKAWNTATDKAVKAGFILAADAKNIKAAAAQSTVGGS